MTSRLDGRGGLLALEGCGGLQRVTHGTMALVDRDDVPALPEVLLGEAPTVKLLYLWLLPQGVVRWSQREIAGALGITQANVSRAMGRLGEVGLLEGEWGTTGRRRGRYLVVAS